MDRRRGRCRRVVDVSFPEIEKFDRLARTQRGRARRRSSQSWRGAASTAHFAWCPYTRGEEVSRPVDDVIAEVAGLADRGVREVNLLGPERERLQRSESSGRDRGLCGVTPSGESGPRD